MDTGGYGHVPLYADIAEDWDVLPVDGGLIGWASAAERDTWFGNLHAIVDGVSILSFEQDNLADIDDATDYERSTTLPTKARVGMRSAVGAGEVWPNLSSFHSALTMVEDGLGIADTVDIDSYIQWREAVDHSSPVIGTVGVAAKFDFAKPDQPVVVIDARPGHLYIVRFSQDLQDPRHGREVARGRTPGRQVERVEIPLAVQGEQGFWTIEQIRD